MRVPDAITEVSVQIVRGRLCAGGTGHLALEPTDCVRGAFERRFELDGVLSQIAGLADLQAGEEAGRLEGVGYFRQRLAEMVVAIFDVTHTLCHLGAD